MPLNCNVRTHFKERHKILQFAHPNKNKIKDIGLNFHVYHIINMKNSEFVFLVRYDIIVIDLSAQLCADVAKRRPTNGAARRAIDARPVGLLLSSRWQKANKTQWIAHELPMITRQFCELEERS